MQTMQIEKFYNDNGEVAILYSPTYGAGWSTWANTYPEFLVFDKTLVQMARSGATESDVEQYLASKEIDEYTGGWKNIKVEYIPVGVLFRIEEYDGNEHVVIQEDQDFFVA